MSERHLFWLVGAWLLPLCAACGAKTQDGGGTDTSTDWVRECDEDAACDDEEHCACGICTRECDTDADCRTLSPDAECAEAPSSCEEPGSICVADTSFAWLSQEPKPGDVPEPSPIGPSPTQDTTCVAAIDKAACCLQVVAVTQSELEAEPCLVEAAGADPEQVWQEAAACQTPDPCPGVDCAPFDARGDWALVAEPNDDGDCELVPPCDDASCAGSPCDPKRGCGNGLVCEATSCDAEGTCRVRPDVECGPAYAPVCGCDGVTYGNPCAVAGGPYDHDGECASDNPECVAALDTAGCCLPVVAVTRSEFDANPCLIEAAGVDLRQGFADVCPPNLCPADCLGVEGRLDLFAIAIASEEGFCELAPACDDATCPGSSCDPRVGCGEGLACAGDSCDDPGTCYLLSESECSSVSNPVCGCDGVTYENASCAYPHAIDHDGECVVEEPTPPCDDGTCDGSPCEPRVGCADGLGCDAAGCDEPGICRPVPNVSCDGNYDPVCGCNGVTYGNACTATGNVIDYEGECAAAE